jgi:uncharacterized membrane protein
MKGAKYLILFSTIIAALEALYFYPLLPSRMAIHFNASGMADGWGPKLPFFVLLGSVFVLLLILFGGLGLLLRKLPDSMLNLPNKEYWLTPERRELTHKRIGEQAFLMGALTLLLLDGVLYLSCSANLSPEPSMHPELLWGMLTVFFTINIGFIILMIRNFRLPEKT